MNKMIRMFETLGEKNMKGALLTILFIIAIAILPITYAGVWSDKSGNGNDLSNLSGAFVSNGGMLLDGYGAHATANSSNSLNLTTAQTIAVWVTINNVPAVFNNNTYFVGKGTDESANGWYGLRGTQSTNTLQGLSYKVRANSTTKTVIDTTNVPIPTARPVFLAGTWNGSSGILATYIDSAIGTTGSFVGTLTTGNNLNLQLGWGGNSSSNNFTLNGTMWDAKVFSTALTTSQINLLYQNKTVSCTSLVAWYDFETADTPCLDYDYLASTTLNFSASVGNMRRDAYGMSEHAWAPSCLSWVDTSNDGILDTQNNCTEMRQDILNLGIGKVRIDAYASSTYGNNTSNFKTENHSSDTDYLIIKDSAEWYSNQSINTTLIYPDKMPVKLADNQTACASDHLTCPPSNNDTWGNFTINYLTALNFCRNSFFCSAELGNEMDLRNNWLLNATGSNNTTTYEQYIQWFNYTRHVIKNTWPQSTICPSGMASGASGGEGANLIQYILSRLGTDLDNGCIKQHAYGDTQAGAGNTLRDKISARAPQWLQYCRNNNKQCVMDIDEYNALNALEQNTTSNQQLLANDIINGIHYLITNIPSNSTFSIYTLTDTSPFGSFSSQYPNRYYIMSQASLNNIYYSPYNMLANLTRHVPASSTVVQWNNSTTKVLPIGSINATRYFSTIFNAQNVSINHTQYVYGITNIYSMIDDLNGTIYYYNSSNSSFQNQILAPYDIRYYEITTDTTAPGLSVTAPVNSTFYGGTAVTLSIAAIDNQGGITTVWYNNGSQNITLFNTSTGASGFNYTNATTIAQGTNRTITVYANDTYNNVTTTTVTFNLNAISIASVSPETPTPRITLGDGQQFLFTLNNPGNVSNNTNWYADSVNITSCYNSTSCAVTGASVGTKNITFTTTSQVNNVTSTWFLTVETSGSTYTRTICQGNAEGALTFSKFSSNIGLILVLAVVVVLLLGAIGVIKFGEMSFQQVGFTMILFTVFVILAGVIVTVVTSSGAC